MWFKNSTKNLQILRSPKGCDTLLQHKDNLVIIGCGKRASLPMPKMKQPKVVTHYSSDNNGTTPLPNSQETRAESNEIVITLSIGKLII